MPLSKPIADSTADSGTIPNPYTVVGPIILDPQSKTVTWTATTWRSKAAWQAGRDPVRTDNYNIYPRATKTDQGGDIPTWQQFVAANQAALDQLRTWFYTTMKTFPEWSGAADVA